MPIVYYPVLRRQSQAFQAGLLQLIQLRRIPDGLTVYPLALPIYNLSARDVLANADLDSVAKLVGSRYFAAGNDAQTTVAGDLDESSTPQLTGLSYGSTPSQALEALQALQDLPELSDSSSYKPQLLRIPGLLVEAFWLTSSDGADTTEWVVPYHTLIKDLDPAQAYTVKDFFDRLRPLAQQVLTENDSPKSTGKERALK